MLTSVGRTSDLMDLKKFYGQCDPVNGNLYLLALPNETWEVIVQVGKRTRIVPEPLLRINFSRDSLKRFDWLSIVAASSDSWLLSVAFYYGAKAKLNKKDRDTLFRKINNLQTVLEVFQRASALPNKCGGGNSSPNNAASGSKVPASKVAKEGGGEEYEEADSFPCGVCGEDGDSMDTFWILCDFCNKWFHGKCVNMTACKAELIGLYKCPCCNNKKRGRV